MTKFNKHNPSEKPCTRWHLFFVSEGIQCANCLALVEDNREQENENEFSTEMPLRKTEIRE